MSIELTTEGYVEPEFAPWDGRRVPMTLLGGYLGAGKTTLINAVLARTDRPIAVLVNDVGSVNVDAALISRHDGDTIELSDGCICCSLNSGFGAAITALTQRDIAPDHVIIELSGVAEPARLRPWGQVAGFRLDGVIVLVDAVNFLQQEDLEVTGPLLANQVTSADLLVVTKTDLADPDQLEELDARLSQLAPDIPRVTAADVEHGAALLELGGRRPGGAVDVADTRLFDHHVVRHEDVEIPLDEAGVHQLLDRLLDADPDLVRVKGVLASTHGTAHLVQVVGRRQLVTPLPDAEHQDPTGLVLISRSVPRP